MKVAMLLAGAGVLALAACGTAPDNGAAPAEQTTAEPTGSVAREVTPTPAPTAVAPLQQSVVATQPGPEGSQVQLNKVAVTGDILTVQLTYQGQKGWDYPKIAQVSVIDDATAQRIGVLKDNAGAWLAAPLGGSPDELRIDLSEQTIVWFKFPAPPATSRTVSINIPGVAPFDGVAVAR